MIVLIVVSFQWVDVGYYGLDVNNVIQQSLVSQTNVRLFFSVDLNKVYSEGRYFVGLGHSFILFPKVSSLFAILFLDDSSALVRPNTLLYR